MTDLHVQAQRLPGIGWRYTIPADRGRHVMVVVEDRGPRYLVLLDPHLDEALTTVRLEAEGADQLVVGSGNWAGSHGCSSGRSAVRSSTTRAAR